MSYKAFEFSLKTEYMFAENPVDALKIQLQKHQPKKPFVLCLDFMTHIPVQAFEDTEIPYVMRTDVISNPTDVYVNSCAAEAMAEGCDFVIGVGGGSVIDSCKAVAMLIANPTEGGIWDYVSFAKQPENPALPVGLVVTIPSTGSESNPSAVISNDSVQEKLIYTEDSLRPRFSITSPSLTYSLPTYPAACGICDILSHLLEQYLHNDTHVDVSDNMLIGVMKAVVQWGPEAMKDPQNFDAKANLLWASYLAMSRVLSALRFWRGKLSNDREPFPVRHPCVLPALRRSDRRYPLFSGDYSQHDSCHRSRGRHVDRSSGLRSRCHRSR